MNFGVIIGTAALLIGLFSLVSALILRSAGRGYSAQLLRYFFLAGIPILFLCSGAGFWDCYSSGDWTKCLVPIAMLLFAANALINRAQCVDLIDKLTKSKQQLDTATKSSMAHQEVQ